jgi:pSer/pThr/pTyr-binding forkhead associated (FHA) protein
VTDEGSTKAPSDDKGQSPPPAPGRRRKTHFWNADPDSKPTLVGDSAAPASDPWASALSDPPPPSEARAALDAPDALAGLLVSFSLEAAGTVHPIRRGKTAIGRAGDPGIDVELDDGKVSSPHCMIIARPSGVFLQDSMSTNGTWFRRGELTEFEDIQTSLNNSARLEDGDFFRVGDSVFLVRLIDPGFVQRIWGD